MTQEMQHQEEVNRFEAELSRVREERKEAKKQEILKQLTEKRRKEQHIDNERTRQINNFRNNDIHK